MWLSDMAVIVASSAGWQDGSHERVPGQTAGAGGGRYQRSSGGLVGAMIVTVLLVLAFAAFRGLTRDNDATPVRAVDWTAMLRGRPRRRQARRCWRRDGCPTGWKATWRRTTPGASPAWHLGLLTDDRKYVGVEESRGSIEDLVEEHVDPDAERGKDVTIAGETWQTWTDAGGDYAVARTRRPPKQQEAVLVVGSAAEPTYARSPAPSRTDRRGRRTERDLAVELSSVDRLGRAADARGGRDPGCVLARAPCRAAPGRPRGPAGRPWRAPRPAPTAPGTPRGWCRPARGCAPPRSAGRGPPRRTGSAAPGRLSHRRPPVSSVHRGRSRSTVVVVAPMRPSATRMWMSCAGLQGRRRWSSAWPSASESTA